MVQFELRSLARFRAARFGPDATINKGKLDLAENLYALYWGVKNEVILISGSASTLHSCSFAFRHKESSNTVPTFATRIR